MSWCALVLAVLGPELPEPSQQEPVAEPAARETTLAVLPRIKRRGMRPHVADALSAARKEVERAPEEAVSWGGFADMLHAHGMFEEAEACYEEAHRRDPRSFRYAHMLAVEYDLCGRDANKTIAAFDRALELRPDYLPGWVRKGHVHFREGDWEASHTAFRHALDADPSYLAASLGLGQVLLSLDRVDEAIEQLERVHAAVPEDRTAATALARAYMRANDRDRAREVALRSHGTEPLIGDEDELREEIEGLAISTYETLLRAQKAMEERRYAEAAEALEAYLAGRSQSPGVRCELGRALLSMGKVREARGELRRALKNDPDLVDANLLLARTYVFGGGGKAGEAGKLLKRALTREPDLQEAFVLQGSMLSVEGQHADAVASFERARLLARRPGVENSYELQNAERFLFAASLLETNELTSARREFEVIVQAEPKHGAAHFGLAEACSRSGDVETALVHYKKAQRLAPSLPAAERIAGLRNR